MDIWERRKTKLSPCAQGLPSQPGDQSIVDHVRCDLAVRRRSALYCRCHCHQVCPLYSELHRYS
jgi:hypothetical protein